MSSPAAKAGGRNLAGRVEDRLDMMAVRIDDEGGIIMRTIVRPRARSAVVTAAMSKCRRMKSRDASTIRGGQGQMKARTRRPLPFRAKFYRKLVAATGNPVAHRLVGLARPEIIPDPDIAELRQHGS